MSEKSGTGSPLISLDQAAMLLMISKERIRQLVAEGRLPKADRNAYPLVGIVRGYLAVLRDEAARRAGSTADADLKAARQREVEVRTAERLRELVPAEEMMAVTQLIVGTLISQMDGLPAQFSRDLSERRRLEAAIDAIRVEITGLVEDADRRYAVSDSAA